MDNSKLKQIAETFLKDHYGLSLNIPINRNNRLRSTYGRFITKNKKAHCIDLAGLLLDYGTDKVIKDILKHECIHYALFQKQLPYHDGAARFEKELTKHHVPATRQLLVGKYFKLECSKCGRISWTNRKRVLTHPEDYRMNCCNGKINVLGEYIFDGTLSDK